VGPAVDIAQVVGVLEWAVDLAQAGRPLRPVLVKQPLPGGCVHPGGVGEDTVGVEHDRLQAIEGKAWPVRLGHVRIIVCQFSRDFVRCPDMYLACAVTLGVG
jgi:hypothetical protein